MGNLNLKEIETSTKKVLEYLNKDPNRQLLTFFDPKTEKPAISIYLKTGDIIMHDPDIKNASVILWKYLQDDFMLALELRFKEMCVERGIEWSQA